MRTLIAAAALLATASVSAAEDLKISHYVANEGSLFSVSSSLIEGPTEIMLVDAQFEKDDAVALVDKIKASGKTLTTVYISHKDPDFYFGVDEVRAAFPDVRIVASPETVAGITKTIQLKNDFWGPILKENAPTDLIIPEVLSDDGFLVDGKTVQVVGLNGHDPAHTFLWVPSQKTVLGGVALYENEHVWMADTQTEASRENWRKTLKQLADLSPERIIPGHVSGPVAEGMVALEHTLTYITDFENAAKAANGSAELIAMMKAQYPDLHGLGSLEISAQVFEGERTWP